MPSDKLNKLSSILFDGEVKAWDFKTMPGTSESKDVDRLSDSLMRSMERMGIVVDGKLVNKNN